MNAPDSQEQTHAARRVVITGFMAAGKTTVARALALRLNCEMVDIDEVISAREKQTIRQLIEERGESVFRDAETSTLKRELERASARIIALGGGAWTFPTNRGLIAEHDCLTVWLDAPFDLCWKRIEREHGTRPLALDRRSAHELFRARRTLYKLAMLSVQVCEEMSADETAADLFKTMHRLGHVKDRD